MGRAERRESHTAEDNVPGIGSGTLTPDAYNQMITDASAFSLTLDSGTRNAIQWIAAKDTILIGTTGGEWSLSGHTRDKPITALPGGYSIRQHTAHGSKDLQPILLTDGFAFINYVGRKLLKLDYDGLDEEYSATELSILAEHITDSGIVDMAFQRNPDPILWLVRADGVLLSMTYDPKQDVVAWARHPLPLGGGVSEASDIPGYATTTYEYTEFFLGIRTQGPTTKYVANGTTDSTLDTTWGSSGYWNGPESGGVCYDAIQLSDGRILVSHTYYTVTMIATDGTTDVSWATNGAYTMPSNVEINKILQDNDGNFHLFAGASGAAYNYVKIDSDGTYITGLNSGVLSNLADAIWSDSSKTRIIAIGSPTVISGVVPNIMAIDPVIGDVDDTWQGNLGKAGYANLAGAGAILNQCKLLSDGGFVILRNDADNTLTKFKSNGSGIDTSWGTSGIVALGTTSVNTPANRMAENNDQLYVLVDDTDTTEAVMTHLDTDGTTLATNRVSVVAGTYHCIELIGDYLYFGTTSIGAATNNVEKWTTAFVFDSGFDLATVNYILFILPDSVTRTSTTTSWTDTTVGVGANSIAVIPSTTEDEVWINVGRVIGDSLVRYIERIKPRDWGDDMEDMFFVDSGLTYDGDPVRNFTELGHLEGETVAILGDGAVFSTQMVTGGTLPNDLDHTVSVAQIGLPFTYRLKPNRMDQNTQSGTSKGSVKKITEAVISFYKTLNARYGDGTDTYDIDWRETSAEYTTPPDLVTGDKVVVADGGFSVEDPFQIEGSDPMPCSVRAIIPRIDQTGR